MPYDRSLLTRWARLFLAILLALGGLQGLWVLRPAISDQQSLIAAAFIAFYAANVAAGWLLWKRPCVGLWLTLVLQLFQLLRIEGPTLSYTLANFAGMWVMPSSGGVELPLNLGSCFQFSRTIGFGTSIPTGPTHVGVNLIAIGMMVAVGVLLRREQSVDRELLVS